ncbi:MAG: flagellar basal body-associated FliL family protein [Candidatus Eisenbacteria bacterium]|uniref:Flagellar protein FliL n=1 Tax=Eiseniibacteriota bacterium TaxID=2212470 RepID=A0A849SJM1_UNCEI|nr:flagellar basal body-associated FliL family protein [Candidatus Eisenbacteria bacterium]
MSGPAAESKGDAAKPDAAKGESAKAPAKPGPSLVILLVVTLVAFVVGGGTGVFVVGPRLIPAPVKPAAHAEGEEGDEESEDEESTHDSKDKKGAHGKEGEGPEKGPVFKLENIILNPAGSQGSRFLLVSVAFEFKDPKAEERFRGHDVEIRDLVIAQLEARTLEQLAQPGARDSLKRLISNAVQPIAGKKTRFKVYLPQFVIQ